MKVMERRAWSDGVDSGIRQAISAKSQDDLLRLCSNAEATFKGFTVKSGRAWAYTKGYWFGLVESCRVAPLATVAGKEAK